MDFSSVKTAFEILENSKDCAAENIWYAVRYIEVNGSIIDKERLIDYLKSHPLPELC